MAIAVSDLQREIDEDQRPLTERVDEFLARQPEQAFGEIEVYAGVELAKGKVPLDPTAVLVAGVALALASSSRERLLQPVRGALHDLVAGGRVKLFQSKRGDFYAHVER